MNKNQCYLPNQKQFYAPIVLTINMMYLSGMISFALNSELQNGILYFGCFVGSRLYKYIQQFSNRVIFYFSDLLFLVSFFLIFLTYFLTLHTKHLFLYYSFTGIFIIGIAGGINLIQVLMYLRLKYADEAISFFSLFIPLQFAIGSVIGSIIYDFPFPHLKQVMLMTFPIMTAVRVLLISIIPFSGLSQNVKQMEETSQNNQTADLQLNQTEEQVGSEKFLQAFLKNFKYLILVIIFQTSSMPFQYHPLQLFLVLFNMIFYQYIDKNKMIVLGQISVCFGYCMNMTIFSASGYYLGLGSLFYPIICKISSSELIMISEISWIIRLSTMCFIAVMQKISYNLFLLDSEVYNNVFFILNFVSLILLISLLFFSKKNEKNKVEFEMILGVQTRGELN
ncbi:unnamed protein product [Paramecium primaurelia]|uniref:Uncharacterized protein n=1 Tax=Paramecium primaurelia TaxID=5886 RepID=A0A8S1KMM2_PARPR|nr:unnamed protein product [Paramecium primaurelia]